MTTHPDWFIERFQTTGSAIGFQIIEQLDHVQSPFQTIDIYKTTDWGNLMVIDGAIMLTTRDNFLYHEMISHPALFTHPHPQRVVIIGGGDCGTLREVLRHPEVTQVTQCDIDEQVTVLAQRHFPELCQANNDPRATLRYADGVVYVRQLPANSIDLLIVDSTDPIGPAEGLFNTAFYRSCFTALTAHGLLIQQSESPLTQIPLIQQMQVAMHQAGFQSFRTLPFPQPCYPTGWWSVTIASKQHNAPFTYRRDDAHTNPFQLQYYCLANHDSALIGPPFLAQALATSHVTAQT